MISGANCLVRFLPKRENTVNHIQIPVVEPAPVAEGGCEAEAAKTRERDVSGITPSGALTLGNHLGALRRFVRRQHATDGFYFVADLHALTTPHDPAAHRDLTRSTAALFFAAGLDPAVSTVFVQSQVSEHMQLSFLLECTAHVGELNRMIQFKEKGGRPGTRASLYTYPCLMAADILLYGSTRVPVGGDQSQHVELARDLAVRFNGLYGPTFVVPELEPAALAAKVLDLQDPTRKMSKSEPPEAGGVVRLVDSPDVIRKKFRRAVTDSDARVQYDMEAKPGVSNLIDIVAVLTDRSVDDVVGEFTSYGALKDAAAEATIAELAPIRRRHDELLNDPAELDRMLARGADRAREVARPVLESAYGAMGVR